MPAWVANDEVWERAKEAALKTYKEGDEAFWPAVTEIYKKMGGKIKGHDSPIEQMVDYVMGLRDKVEDVLSAVRVKQHIRTSKTGKIVNVREHEDVRKPHEVQLEPDFVKLEDIAGAYRQKGEFQKSAAPHGTQVYTYKSEGPHWEAAKEAHKHLTKLAKKRGGVTVEFSGGRGGPYTGVHELHESGHEVRHIFENKEPERKVKPKHGKSEILMHLYNSVPEEQHPKVREYIQEAEHQDGTDYGKQFTDRDEALEDFKLYHKIEQEVELEGKKTKKASQASSPHSLGDLVQASDPTSDIIQCRSAVGSHIRTSAPWIPEEPVEFIYAPEGQHTITAGFRKNDTITISVIVDDKTPDDLQDAFGHLTATMPKQEPYGDEDHESKKATVRFPVSGTQFRWGEIKGERGVVISGGQPTTYGADAVNGKVYRSWSPEFTTDADFGKAKKSEDNHWTFPEGVRGSESNPARIVGVNFVVGALTNRPAFRAMPPVRAKQADPVKAAETTSPSCNLAAMVTNVQLAHWAADTKSNEHKALGELYESLSGLVDSFVEASAGKTGELPKGSASVPVQVETNLTAVTEGCISVIAAAKAGLQAGADDDLLNIIADMENACNKARYLLKAADGETSDTVKASSPSNPEAILAALGEQKKAAENILSQLAQAGAPR